MLTDTHPDADAFQLELLRRASAAENFSLVRSLTAVVVSLCRQGIRERHPEFDERAVDLHFVEMNYGRELAEGLRRRLEGKVLEFRGGDTSSFQCGHHRSE